MTGNAVTWNRKVQGLESSGKDRQTGECTYGQEPYGYIVIICAFTRWVELYWCQDATASWACDCLLQLFGRFGSPSLIRSDRGSHFANDLITEFLDRIGTPHNLTLAYSKQENALVERVNKEVNRHHRDDPSK